VSDELSTTAAGLVSRYRVRTRPQSIAIVMVAVISVAISAGVCVASVLVPAPPGVLPLVVLACTGGPMFASWDLPPAIASLRAERARRGARAAVAKLRRNLEELPETDHPLGL
jgi:hypothetical protein